MRKVKPIQLSPKQKMRIQFLETLFAHILTLERQGIKIPGYKMLIG